VNARPGLAITDEHAALAEVVRDFAESRDLWAACRGLLDLAADVDTPAPGEADSTISDWKDLAGLGWLGLHIEESHGGAGFGLAELAVVADELGYALSPGPFLPAAVAAAVLSRYGTAAQRERFLGGILDGSTIVGLQVAPGLRRQDDGTLGTAGMVLAGRWAGVLMVRAGDDIVLISTDDLTVTPMAGLDASLGLARADTAGMRPPPDAILAGAGRFAIRMLRVLAATQAAGGVRACLDLALDHARVREQFGRPIGSFQAVKHHLANMLMSAELASAAGWDAARACSVAPVASRPADPDHPDSDDQADLAAAAAAIIAPRAYQEAAQKAVQLLGALGFTWEHDAHLYLRRAVALKVVVDAAGSAADELFATVASGARRRPGIDLPEPAGEYRREVQEFRDRYVDAPMQTRHDVLLASGYLVPHWPRPFGRAAGAVEQLVIEEELADVHLPSLGIGGWVLPTLLQAANPDQIRRWIGPSLAGELVWCQLFSEPEAGSDAASVRARGERVDGGWRLNGCKVWISGAQFGDRALATIRTDPTVAKHRGITAMVVDLHARGVTIRPLRDLTGTPRFSEVTLDDVFVPDADVVGEVGAGWQVARAALGNERVSTGGRWREGLPALALVGLVQRYPSDVQQEVRRRVGRLLAEAQALHAVNLRRAARAVAGRKPGPEGSVTKVVAAEHAQRVSELAIEIVGPAVVLADDERISREYLFGRSLTIGGGTSEIARTVIAERILGLPRE
jgi:3-oxochol-4-en-24-oyl-CoA dehydrogenase